MSVIVDMEAEETVRKKWCVKKTSEVDEDCHSSKCWGSISGLMHAGGMALQGMSVGHGVLYCG